MVILRGQACCGALSLHSGRTGEAAWCARHAIETFEQAWVEAIVVNSAGRGSAMTGDAELLADDPEWAERAAALSAKVRDFAEFLADLFETTVARPRPGTRCRSGSCVTTTLSSRARPEGDRGAARPAERHPGPRAGGGPRGRDVLRLGGRLQPAATRGGDEPGERKAASVYSTGARLVISANPGCSLQIVSALEAMGQSIAVAHTAEILDASIRDVAVPGRPYRRSGPAAVGPGPGPLSGRCTAAGVDVVTPRRARPASFGHRRTRADG